MNEHISQELSDEAAYKEMAKSPLILSDWVYIKLNEGEPYLDENGHFRTVGWKKKLRLVFDRYDAAGTVVNNTLYVRRKATFNIEGQQICGTLISHATDPHLNNPIRCMVLADRILALRYTHELTTNDLPLEVVRSKAIVTSFTGW